ncbi:hypothetical protein Tco_1014469 [Tanacetum coccineum]
MKMSIKMGLLNLDQIQSVKTSGFDKSFESDRMVFIYDVLAEFDAMNKGKQVLGHRFRGCYDMLRWSTDENKAVYPGYYLIPTDGFLLTHTVPADLLYTDFFGRFWFLMIGESSEGLGDSTSSANQLYLILFISDHSMEPIGSEVYRRALLEGKSSAYSYLS